MDGVGVAPPGPGNAVTLANTQNLDKYWPMYPHTYLEAAGLNVGLPSGTDGNSEVGHMTMGAGKVIFQNLPRIDNAVRTGSFYQNPVLKEAFDFAKKNKGNVHLLGLVGSGFVHSSIDHLEAIIKFAALEKVDKNSLFVHAITDGRDSPPKSAIEILEKIETWLIQRRVGKLASIIGRAYAMDRNRNWQRTKMAYDLYTQGGTKVKDWHKAIEESYKKNVLDEYLEPISIVKGNEDPAVIKENDAVIFFNFRPDRAYQIDFAFESDEFSEWQRAKINNLYWVGMTDYENGFPRRKAFPPEKVTMPLGRVLSEHGLKQLRIAESEKFPHVTYFFNGQNKEITAGETWIEVPSPKDVATYDLKPEMSQKWVTDVLVDKIKSGEYDFIMVNYAGPDMVGHTGVIDAAVKAMTVCDQCVGRIVEAALEVGGAVVISADHGNAEEMIDTQTGAPDTKHSTNQVPFLLIANELPGRELPVGGLADIAPTILGLMGIEVPPEMTGRNLLA
ncbi:MAG: 2,3-bisphosphoglycerate-independent phosphoglycerate mutase [Ignavibacteriaceae bacterium]|nr:2,3-bisphosphoglycerate-independent phosphoglycerate mutase [Ignavibacteriaceae bacterium]